MRTSRLALLALLASCGGARVSLVNDLENPAALAACSTGDVAANTAIVSDLVDSYHEMIVCGGLQLDFTNALVNVIANAALGRGGPAQLVYQGNGRFATTNGMMAIDATLTNGTPLTFDVLDPQSYLVGVTVNANASSVLAAGARGGSPWQMLGHAAGSLEITFQAEGPGFALLGLTSQEARGGHLDLTKIARSLEASISLANRINVDNEHGSTTVHYILEGSAVSLRDIHDGKKVPMQLASIQANHPATNQTIKVTEWTMQFKGDGGKVLDGTIGMDIEGGAFPYHVKLTYPHNVTPSIELSCK